MASMPSRQSGWPSGRRASSPAISMPPEYRAVAPGARQASVTSAPSRAAAAAATHPASPPPMTRTRVKRGPRKIADFVG